MFAQGDAQEHSVCMRLYVKSGSAVSYQTSWMMVMETRQPHILTGSARFLHFSAMGWPPASGYVSARRRRMLMTRRALPELKRTGENLQEKAVIGARTREQDVCSEFIDSIVEEGADVDVTGRESSQS